jgi:hypothetical protein
LWVYVGLYDVTRTRNRNVTVGVAGVADSNDLADLDEFVPHGYKCTD